MPHFLLAEIRISLLFVKNAIFLSWNDLTHAVYSDVRVYKRKQHKTNKHFVNLTTIFYKFILYC